MAVRYRFIVVLGTLLCGLVSLVLGFLLYRAGITGVAELGGAWNERKFWLTSGGPGAFFAIAGAVIVVSVVRQALNVGQGGAGEAGAPDSGGGGGGGGGGPGRATVRWRH